MYLILLIALGSAIGGVGRYGMTELFYVWLGRAFPYGTLVINVLGSWLIGLLFVVITERFHARADELYRLGITGFLGGFTTFSAFSLETVGLLQQGFIKRAVLYVLLSVFVSLIATGIGLWMGKEFF